MFKVLTTVGVYLLNGTVMMLDAIGIIGRLIRGEDAAEVWLEPYAPTNQGPFK